MNWINYLELIIMVKCNINIKYRYSGYLNANLEGTV